MILEVYVVFLDSSIDNQTVLLELWYDSNNHERVSLLVRTGAELQLLRLILHPTT